MPRIAIICERNCKTKHVIHTELNINDVLNQHYQLQAHGSKINLNCEIKDSNTKHKFQYSLIIIILKILNRAIKIRDKISERASQNSKLLKQTSRSLSVSVERDLDVTVGNLLLQILRVLAVDGAADGNAGAEDLLDAATELLGHGPRAHDLGDLDDVVERDVAVVFDVLGLLAVALWLFEGLDDQGSGGRDHRDFRLAILDGQLHRHAEALPVLRGLLCDVLSYLFGGETKGTDLRGE